jgi:hypothetical protein
MVAENSRALDQDTVADSRVRRPLRQKVEQHRTVRFLVSFPGVGPIAAPDEPLGGGLDICLCDRRRIGVGRRPDLSVGIGARLFDPGPTFVDQCPDLPELRGRPARKPAAAPGDMTFSNSRRSQGVPGMISPNDSPETLPLRLVHRRPWCRTLYSQRRWPPGRRRLCGSLTDTSVPRLTGAPAHSQASKCSAFVKEYAPLDTDQFASTTRIISAGSPTDNGPDQAPSLRRGGLHWSAAQRLL